MDFKKNLQSDVLVAKVYYLEDDFLVFYKNLELGVLKSVKMSLNYIKGDELTVEFETYSVYKEFFDLSRERDIAIQIMVYDEEELDDETTPTSKYNNIFFVSKKSISEKVDGDSTYQLFGKDWKGFIEYRRFLTHTVFYEPEEIPVENGEKKYPDDFNKIKFGDIFFQDQLRYFYENDIFDPYFLAKGSKPLKTDEHRQIGILLGTELTINEDRFDIYNTLQERKTLGDYKEAYYKTAFDNGNYTVARVDTKLQKVVDGYKIRVAYNPRTNHQISNEFGNDDVSEATYDIDANEYYNSIYVESGKEDFISTHYQKRGTNEITTYEFFETSQEDGGNTTSMSNYAKQLMSEKMKKVTRTAMIYFAKKDYLKDVKIGDIVEMTDFNDLLNGEFIISKLTMVIENNTVDFSIDEMIEI